VITRSSLTELEAELYALTHRGQPGDAEFYARHCAGASRVLELGTGHGRLLPALAAAAAQVVGLDREPEFLRSARRRVRRLPAAERAAVQLVQGDLRDFELGRRFDRILVPYNALYCLLGSRALASCLRCVRAHLAPGGQLLFDVWAADAFAQHVRAGDRRDHRDDPGAIVSFRHRRQTWDVYERSSLRSARQRLDVVYTYVSRERGQRVQIEIHQRYSTSSELARELGRAGLELRARWAGFAGERFTARAELLVVRASA
jgi:SAM-dependent methyltransferase